MGQQGGGNNTLKWVIGCGVGCLVLCIVGAIVIGVGGYYAATKGFSAAGKEMATQMNTDYSKMKSESKVPAEQVAVFDDIIAATQKEGVSMWTVTISSMAVYGILQDGQVSEDEAKQATTIRDFVVDNPDCSMIEMGAFMQQHPELSHLQQSMPQGMKNYPAPSAPASANTSEVTPPAEAPANEAPEGGA